jgi:hypothetical protein
MVFACEQRRLHSWLTTRPLAIGSALVRMLLSLFRNLHRLWVSGEVYEPLRNSQKAMRAAA